VSFLNAEESRCILDSNKAINAYGVRLSTFWTPRVVFRTFSAASYVSARAGDFALSGARWGLWKAIEYVENPDGTPGFHPEDNDTIVQHFRFYSNQSWSAMQTTTSGPITTYCSSRTINGQLPNRAPSGMTLSAQICGSFTTVEAMNGNEELEPRTFEWTLTLSSIGWLDSDSRLAIKLSFDTTADIGMLDSDSTGGAIGGVNVGAGVIFTWDNMVGVTGSGGSCSDEAPVVMDVVRDVESVIDVDPDYPLKLLPVDPDNITVRNHWRITYFSFLTNTTCRPTGLTWDPSSTGPEDQSLMCTGSGCSSAAAHLGPISLTFLAFLFVLIKYF